MSDSQIRDYTSILDFHILPRFSDAAFSEFWSLAVLKKFVAELMGKTNRHNQPLSPKMIQNILIPLRTIVRDGIDEHGWTDRGDPFSHLKLPKVKKIRIYPFDLKEWQILMVYIRPWYHRILSFLLRPV